MNRREFFKTTALGTASLALAPSFSHLLASPAQAAAGVVAAGAIPHRFVFIRKSNGNLPVQFALPSFSSEQAEMNNNKQAFEVDLAKHELPEWLRGLEAHKENMTMLHGISMKMCGGGHYSYSGCMGAFMAGRNILSKIKRATIDFELARLSPSPFGHIECSLDTLGGSQFCSGIVEGKSAPAPQTRNYCYADPMSAYDELFKSITDKKLVESDNALLDFLYEEESHALKGLEGEERNKINNQAMALEAIRERNQKVAAMGDVIRKHIPTLDPIHLNGGQDATLAQKQEAFTDVIVAALAAGLTNVVTFTIDTLGTPIQSLPENEENTSIHAIGHGGLDGRPAEMRNIIKTYHMKQVETLVTKLKAIPEGNGSLFDNTTIIYMPETGAGHHGPNTEAPMVIMSGRNSKLDIAGRYIRLPFHGEKGHKTLGNWYTTLLNAYGNPIEHYGDLDLTMQRNRLDQTGAITRFMV